MSKVTAKRPPSRRAVELAAESPFDAACRYLARRRLSEAEVRQRLSRRFNAEQVEETLAKLREYQFVDDEALIADVVRERLAIAPRSTELMEAELERRGISPELFQQIFSSEFPDYDPLTVAQHALQQQTHLLRQIPVTQRRLKALRFLTSRGFDAETALEAWEKIRSIVEVV